jgi:hypothetical protein
MTKKVLLGLLVLAGGLLLLAAARGGHYEVHRSSRVKAAPGVVFAQIESFRSWSAWSPWSRRDPAMKRLFSGPEKGVGATFTWVSDVVGRGRMTITEVEPPLHVGYRLELARPSASAQATFRLEPMGDEVLVTWSLLGRKGLVARVLSLIVDLEGRIGADLEEGLGELKTVSEAAATRGASLSP